MRREGGSWTYVNSRRNQGPNRTITRNRLDPSTAWFLLYLFILAPVAVHIWTCTTAPWHTRWALSINPGLKPLVSSALQKPEHPAALSAECQRRLLSAPHDKYKLAAVTRIIQGSVQLDMILWLKKIIHHNQRKHLTCCGPEGHTSSD